MNGGCRWPQQKTRHPLSQTAIMGVVYEKVRRTSGPRYLSRFFKLFCGGIDCTAPAVVVTGANQLRSHRHKSAGLDHPSAFAGGRAEPFPPAEQLDSRGPG